MTATTTRPDVGQVAAPPPPAPAAAPALAICVSVVITLVVVNMLVVRMEPHLLDILRFDQQGSVAKVVEYDDAPRPDVLFMGTSRAFSGFDPSVTEAEVKRATGADIYAHNLGVGGGAIEIQYLLLKNILREDKLPTVIVYGLTEAEFAVAETNPVDYLPYANLLLRSDDYGRYAGATLDSKLSFWADRLFPLYRDRRIITTAASIALNPHDPYHKFFAAGPDRRVPPANGFSPGSGNIRAPAAQLAQNLAEYAPFLSDYRFGHSRIQLFHDFLTLAESKGITVVVVNMPVNDEMRALWSSEARIDDYRAMVQLVAGDHGVPVLDLYHGSQTLPSDGFWDWHHLNAVGAAVVTRLVTRNLVIPVLTGEAVAVSGGSPTLRRLTQTPVFDLRPAPGGSPTVIERLFPDSVVAGDGFNVQPDGQWALAVKTSNTTNASIIVFAGTRLETASNPEGILTARVPPQLIAQPGTYPVQVTDGQSDSNIVNFVVRRPGTPAVPKAAASPPAAANPVVVEALFPSSIAVGEGFNVQPDGQSALAVKAANATDASVIVFGGTRLETVRSAADLLTAKVPARLTARPGQIPVTVADGETVSNAVTFAVRAQ